MKKYLFTDGTNGVRELQSQEELEIFIESAEQPDKIKIWLFSSSEWISYAAFRKLYPGLTRKEAPAVAVANHTLPGRASNGKRWLKKFLFVMMAAAGVFLVFNFTKIKWEKASPVNTTAARPANVPVIDIDSLITEIEYDRDQSLDRSTKNNLRLRNTWPDRIELKLNSERETNNSVSRYFNINVSLDNSTGFNLDEAVVKLSIWKNGKLSNSDTLKFNNIRYDKLSVRQLNNDYRGDSIAIAFESIRSKAFNLCYSAAIKNNSGNYNDRWFCRGE